MNTLALVLAAASTTAFPTVQIKDDAGVVRTVSTDRLAGGVATALDGIGASDEEIVGYAQQIAVGMTQAPVRIASMIGGTQIVTQIDDVDCIDVDVAGLGTTCFSLNLGQMARMHDDGIGFDIVG